MEVVIRVFGPEPGCAKCKGAEKVAAEVAQKFEGVTVKKCDVFSEEAEECGIMMTPTVMVNDLTVEVGRIPSVETLESAVKKVLGDGSE
ncbi:MAG: thioredoxin family protein [Theionarchaea archaeon]|nr:thioredoxin family protein [Theionarchaea archaeon]MBU7038030.1 thioredoxin family protein [Theionarchaea archaeon]